MDLRKYTITYNEDGEWIIVENGKQISPSFSLRSFAVAWLESYDHDHFDVYVLRI